MSIIDSSDLDELRDKAEQSDKLKVELERWQKAERRLSEAYLRLREMIPGAFDTPHSPTPEQVWETTERALERCLK